MMRLSLWFVMASLSLSPLGCASPTEDRPPAATQGEDGPDTEEATGDGSQGAVDGQPAEAIGPGAQPDRPRLRPTLPKEDAPEATGESVTPRVPAPSDTPSSPRTPKPATPDEPDEPDEVGDEAETGAIPEGPAEASPEEERTGEDPEGPAAPPAGEAGAQDQPEEGEAAPQDRPEEGEAPEAPQGRPPEGEAPPERPEEAGGDRPADAGLCARATDHLRNCIGVAIEPDACVDAAAEEADLLLALNCEELEDLRSVGGGAAPLCAWLGWGCEALNPCVPAFTPAGFRQVLRQTEAADLRTAVDVLASLEALTDLMAPRDDPRGLFATAYVPITEAAVDAIDGDAFEDSPWAEALVVDFAGRYLDNLRHHLLAGEVTLEWRRHYKLAEACDVSRLRAVVSAIATHLIVDLPYALQAIDTAPERQADFETFGDLLVTATPSLIEDLREDYGVDGEALLTGFFAGEIMDGALGELTTTSFMFQTVRTNAWRNGQLLLAPATAWIAFAEILSSWGAADALFERLENRGAI